MKYLENSPKCSVDSISQKWILRGCKASIAGRVQGTGQSR